MPLSYGKQALLALSGLLYLLYTDATVTYNLLTGDSEDTAEGQTLLWTTVCLYLGSALALLIGVIICLRRCSGSDVSFHIHYAQHIAYIRIFYLATIWNGRNKKIKTSGGTDLFLIFSSLMSFCVAAGGVGMAIAHQDEESGYTYNEPAGRYYYAEPFTSTESTVMSGIGAAWGIISVGLAIYTAYQNKQERRMEKGY
ncbi:hypothetical protein BG004_002660 [Podila humilis]|nr:hypothetical protein BG004_002660 [Podila humilis]